jgi:ComF family protein
MLDTLISIIAPHLCCSCGRIGTLLCENCKYDISLEYFSGCLVCGQSIVGSCAPCAQAYSRSWCVGERSGALRSIVDNYKFYNHYAAYRDLASLLSDCIGQLPPNCTIVPIPTVTSHIRQRGYDHTLLIAKDLAKRQGIPFATPLARHTSTKQRGQNRIQRQTQASQAFSVKGTLSKDTIYLIVDDVVTTGATLHYAAKALREAGAVTIWVAAIARQPLD